MRLSTSRKALLAAALVGTLPTARAAAADLDYGYGSAPPPIAESKVEFGSGWYVRGDIGVTTGTGVGAGDEPYDSSQFSVTAPPTVTPGQPATSTTVKNSDGTTTTTTTPATPAIVTPSPLPTRYFPNGISSGPGQTPPSLNSASGVLNYTASLGAGYQFNRWIRSDLMFDFHQPIQNSRQGAGVPCITGTAIYGASPAEIPLSTTCTPTLKATLKSYDVLINGYLDLGTWYRFTPYVGAGVGLSFGYASASSHYVQNNGVAYNVSYTDALNGAVYNQYWDRSQGKQYYNFAFAAMAGVAYDIYPHTKLDVGYRYLHLGQIIGTNVATQEARVGLRYMLF